MSFHKRVMKKTKALAKTFLVAWFQVIKFLSGKFLEKYVLDNRDMM